MMWSNASSDCSGVEFFTASLIECSMASHASWARGRVKIRTSARQSHYTWDKCEAELHLERRRIHGLSRRRVATPTMLLPVPCGAIRCRLITVRASLFDPLSQHARPLCWNIHRMRQSNFAKAAHRACTHFFQEQSPSVF